MLRPAKPRTAIIVEQLRAREQDGVRQAGNAKAAPRGSLQRLFDSIRHPRAGKHRVSAPADARAQRLHEHSRARPSFDLKLEGGKLRVRPLHPSFSREQARRLERELNNKQRPVTGLAWNDATHGYTIFHKDGPPHWLGTVGTAIPIVGLAPHHAAGDLSTPPPIGLLAGVSGSADGGLWRAHHGKLYRWDATRNEWEPVRTAADEHGPIELIGRQLDGHAWARAGSMLLKLGAHGIEAHRLHDGGPYSAVCVGPNGARWALDSGGRLCRPDQPGAAPCTIALQLSDGRAAFEPIELGNPAKPAERARAIDFQLAPDGNTAFLRDGAGHLYQADLRGSNNRSGQIVARRLPNPMHQPAAREGWRTDALTMAPDREGQTAALHAVFSSSNGQRVTAVWDGEAWKPQFHVEQPLLLINDRGLEEEPMSNVVDYGNGISLGISEDGHVHTREGELGWQPLLMADGRRVPDLVDLKLGPAGLSDAKSIYARQQDRDGRARILKLDLGGALARLPARAGGSLVALPAQRHVNRITAIAQTDTPMLDFAVDGKDVAYHLSGNRSVVRTAPGSQPQPLPALPGRARIQQIAVAGDGDQLFALARGPLRHGDAPRMPTLFRFDRQSASWVNCRINVSWDDPLHLSISNLGTLQLAVDKPGGERKLYRLLPPVGNGDAYRLQAIGPDEVPVSTALVDAAPKRIRIPGTGAFATVSQTRGGVTEWGKSRFSAALGHAERVLSAPKGAIARIREERDGREDMAAEYSAMRTIHEALDRLLASGHFPLPPAAQADTFVRPALIEAEEQTCASLRDDALAGMLAELQRIGVRAGVLGPDLSLTAKAEKRRRAAGSVEPDPHDLLPRMIAWFAEATARAEANARRASTEGTSTDAPIFSGAELGRMRRVLSLMQQLRDHGLTVPDADLSLPRDNRHDAAITAGAIGRHLLTFERATRLVATDDAKGRAGNAEVDMDPTAAAAALKREVSGDKILRLARLGFSGWQDAEAHWEVVQSFRKEIAKPRAPLARKLKESLAIEDVRHTDEVAVKLAEAMKGLSNRSTLFGIESRGASVGATASGAVFTRAGAWGFTTLGIDRTTMVGVERTADQLNEGPLVAFFVRQSVKSVATGSGFGLDFKPLNRVLGTRAQGQIQGTAGLMHGKGAAMLVQPNAIDEFCRRLCDANEDPGRVLELGINSGAIGLDMQEKQITVGATVGGLAGYGDPIPAFGPPAGNAAHAFQQTGLQRGFLGGNVSWTARDFLLKLQHAWEPISGYEYQGGSGWTANAFASLVEQGGLLPHVSDAFTLVLRSLNVTLIGASVEWSGVESFKRTLDWKTATPVPPEEWQQLAELAKTVFPSHAIGHMGGPKFKDLIPAMLEDARTTWSASSEHERAAFVHRAEQMLLQDALAERGRAMLLPGAKIEINIPNVDALKKGQKSSKAHRSLGPVMESSVRARESIPGLDNAMRAMARLEGTNDTRFVFQMDPGYINAVNRQMLEGTMSWEELNVLARTMPAPYRLTEICAKDSDTNRSALSINPLPVLAFNDSAETSRSLFTAEAHLRYGLDGSIIGCDLLPGAQRAARDQPLLQPFARADIHPVRPMVGSLPPQAPDLPQLRRSQSHPTLRRDGRAAKPFASRTR
ncbi:AvrE-family type 3 secretion system effector [Trinickia caryophylli]|uniref:Type III effector protein n=1 Tax=Trinickia caryophylli TaxID=28094 RepID=A0A1X7EAE1_TRICW|nr:AvrE-family type 3 secretion system effector [Trinickia caryophylli]PMS12986.1 type III effector protein [Trinickia caryophylli]TRX14747.1 type III effector protein [Trinickia caryophylli]WQE14594.1 AvrE-family type 3 secretion system effector [Trinickia caryophylli]SMF30283.1 hypothetical protein SAMN06295900_105107 [Trinickia caryophylli]GLU31991.1 type III effector [Trinickia caryophylli]